MKGVLVVVIVVGLGVLWLLSHSDGVDNQPIPQRKSPYTDGR
jgi:hypothetical protein